MLLVSTLVSASFGVREPGYDRLPFNNEPPNSSQNESRRDRSGLVIEKGRSILGDITDNAPQPKASDLR